MELIKLSERIYMLPFVRETDRPNLFYIKGDNYSVAVDAGNSAAHVQEFYVQLAKHGLEMPRYTIITHWHWDHTFGLHAICGKSIATVKTNEKLRQVMKWEWTKEKMREREDADCEDHYENGGRYDADRLLDLIEFLKEIDYQRHLISHDFEESKEEALTYLSEELEKCRI
ncbi:MAG: MBL fold metallo-hydrolase [Suilimivivens sp.]